MTFEVETQKYDYFRDNREAANSREETGVIGGLCG